MIEGTGDVPATPTIHQPANSAMPGEFPRIDLEGFERLHTLERDLAWAPVTIALSLVAWAGLALMAVFGLAMFATFLPERDCAIALAVSAVITAGAVGLERAYMFYRLARLGCPQCGRLLRRYVADVTDAERRAWGIRGLYLGGCLYSRPFIGEGDQRTWVRVMKEVRACPSCRLYVDYGEPHEETCSAAELQRLGQHRSGGRQGSDAA